MPKIEVIIKSVYGNDLIYPANQEARIFADLTGKKTLSKADLDKIRALGFAVIQTPNHAHL